MTRPPLTHQELYTELFLSPVFDMRRSAVLLTGLLLLSLGGLAGCDTFEDSPSEVEDFDIQENMITPSARTVTPDLNPQFAVSYQGLSEPPSVEASSDILSIETLSTEGDANRGGERSWQLSLATESLDEILRQEELRIQGITEEGNTITDTLSVAATTTLAVEQNFESSYATIADYEGDVTSDTYGDNEVDTESYSGSQRQIEVSGGTTTTLANSSFSQSDNQPSGSNGVRFLEIDGSSSGSVTIQRWISVPNSDVFTFLVRPAATSFNLTITLTEETGDGTTSYDFELPIPAGGDWLKIGIPFEFFEGFNPVASRAGGNGPLTSISFAADQGVSYAIDELIFGKEGVGGRAEFHDFERTTLAYGPPFGSNTFGFAMGTDSISAQSDGLTSRRISGESFFGYNYGQLYLDVDGNDVISFRAKGSTKTERADEVEVFLETPGGAGGFGDPVSRVAPEGSWQKFEIPVSDLGSDPSALQNPGINNIGFNADGTFLLDDVKIIPKE